MYQNLFSDENFVKQLKDFLLNNYLVFGEGMHELKIAETAVVNNALFNLVCGDVTIEDYAFFGHNVSILTGTHDIHSTNRLRQDSVPEHGNDITIEEGVWISSNSTIIGPAIIGRHAVIAAGAVVIGDVPPYTLYGGVPAQFIKKIEVK